MTTYAALQTGQRDSRRIAYSDQALKADLQRLRESWEKLQRSRSREAVYPFLSNVFEVVAWWTAEKRATGRACRALRLCGLAIPETVEPFAALIVVAAHPTKLDRRSISRWSRVLRYAKKYKLRSEPLGRFIRRKGGINDVAALYARRLERGGST